MTAAFIVETTDPEGPVCCKYAATRHAASQIALREAAKIAQDAHDAIQMRDRIKRHSAIISNAPAASYSAHSLNGVGHVHVWCLTQEEAEIHMDTFPQHY